jgi:hypothetical protein
MVKELKMKLSELIEIQASMRALRDGVLNDYETMSKFKKELLDISRCMGMLSYVIETRTKDIEVEVE